MSATFIDEVRALRDDLHAQAYELNSHCLTQAAQALWSVVEALDGMLNRLDTRRRP